MPYIKRGDFSITSIPSHGSRLIHQCRYQNATSVTLKEVSLCGYNDGNIYIKAQALNEAGYLALKQQILLAGFPEPDFSDYVLNSVGVITSDRSMISTFLNAIKQFSPDVAEIEQDIALTLGLDLAARAAMPTWHRNGDFLNVSNMGSDIPLIRQIHYTVAAPDSLVKEFSLFGYRDNNFTFQIELTADNTALLRQALAASRLLLENAIVGSAIKLKFNANSIDNFHQLLTILSQHSRHFAEICENFKEYVHPVVTLPFVPVPQPANVPGTMFNAPFTFRRDREINLAAAGAPIRRPLIMARGFNIAEEMLQEMREQERERPVIPRLANRLERVGLNLADPLAAILAQTFNAQPLRAPAITMPVKGINEKILDDIDCDDIPSEYLCAMGCAVMTDPVFDPKHPEIKFEKSWILPALELKKENPYTKTPLQSDQLQLDVELKQAIDTFVKSKVEEHAAQSKQESSARP